MKYAHSAADSASEHTFHWVKSLQDERSAFTLIELLIVVVIISFIAAVAVPTVLGRLDRGQEGEAERSSEAIRQSPPSAEAASRPGGEVGRPPQIEASNVRLDLRSAPVLDGFRVFTRYEVDFRGMFVVRNVDPVVDTITLRFPFPPAINEARGVSLQLRDELGGLSEPLGVDYALDGIEWTGHVGPGEAVTAVVSYTAQGRDALVYDVAGPGRLGTVTVELRLENAARTVIPAGALQPVEREDRSLRWNFDALITNKAIVVELPAGSSPLGRVILVLQLAGVAVLLFGGGFWYLSEMGSPGRLDDFRWGHFLLLALNYSLFFGIFAVLGYRGSTAVALTTATVVSLPLLTIHAIRITDRSFALTRVLPLAVITLAAVMGGVLLEQHRPLLFLGFGVGLAAFLTVSYRSWASERKAHWELGETRRECEVRELQLVEVLDELRTAAQHQQLVLFSARQALDDAHPGHTAERDEVVRYVELLDKALGRATSVAEEKVEWSELDPDDHQARAEDLRTGAEKSLRRLQGRGKALERTVDILELATNDATDRLRENLGSLEVALGEGTVVEVEARTLMEEGDERLKREQSEVEQALSRLSRARQDAERLGEGKGADDETRTRASAAAHHARAVTAHVDLLRDAVEQLRVSTRLILRQDRKEAGAMMSAHCGACGEALPLRDLFCASCGTPRPLELDCPECGHTTRLPGHLMRKRWSRRRLHCSSCGLVLEEGKGE